MRRDQYESVWQRAIHDQRPQLSTFPTWRLVTSPSDSGRTDPQYANCPAGPSFGCLRADGLVMVRDRAFAAAGHRLRNADLLSGSIGAWPRPLRPLVVAVLIPVAGSGLRTPSGLSAAPGGMPARVVTEWARRRCRTRCRRDRPCIATGSLPARGRCLAQASARRWFRSRS
jgi:hypothetical protein